MEIEKNGFLIVPFHSCTELCLHLYPLFFILVKIKMPNYCNGRVRISGLTEKQKERIGRWTVQGILCAMIIPYSKEVKKDLENKHNFDKEYALLIKKMISDRRKYE